MIIIIIVKLIAVLFGSSVTLAYRLFIIVIICRTEYSVQYWLYIPCI